MAPNTHKMTLSEFKASTGPHGADQLLHLFNGGAFSECHQAVFAQTGIWIDELVPVFQKLDAHLVLRAAPRH